MTDEELNDLKLKWIEFGYKIGYSEAEKKYLVEKFLNEKKGEE